MQSERTDVDLKGQKQNEKNRYFEKINEIQEIFEEFIGDSVKAVVNQVFRRLYC